MSDSLSAELWRGVTGVYDAILAHPFLTGLTDGSLPHDAFAFYVVQGALYLRRYSEALAEVGRRAPSAAAAMEVEKSLHGSLLADLGVDPATVGSSDPAPTNLAYTSYLLATVCTGS